MIGPLSFSTPPPLKPNRRIRVALRLEDWPAEDQKRWNAAFVRAGLFEEQGVGSHLSSRTRVSLANAYGRWLGVLARHDPEALTLTAAERTTPERVHLFATILRNTNLGRSVASQIRHLRGAIRLLAPEMDTSWMLKIASGIEAQSPRRDRRPRLRLSHELDALADKLMNEAEIEFEALSRPSKKAALAFRDGLIIALLTIAPMRRRNLASLAIGCHLIRAGRNWSILLSADETKGKEALEYPLSDKLSRTLDRYLDVFRPALYCSDTHDGLWASAKGIQASGNALYDAICRRTRTEFGVSMNLHLFRDAAFSFLALYAPEQVGVGRDLLGHKHLHTGEQFYQTAQTVLASRVVAELLEKKRKR
jgi:integrase